jgi:hypothetical protein
MRVDAAKGSVRWADDIEELLAPPPQIEVGWRVTQRASQLLPSRRRAFAPRHRPTMRHKLRNSLIEQRIERVIPVAPTLLITSPTRRSIVRRQRRHPNGAEVEPIFESMVVPKGVLKGAKLGRHRRAGNVSVAAVRQRATLLRVDGIDALPTTVVRARAAVRAPQLSAARAAPDARRAVAERGGDERGVANSRRVAIQLSGRAVQFPPASAALRASAAAAQRRTAVKRECGRQVAVGAASRSVSRRSARRAERDRQELLARDAEEDMKFLYNVARVSEWRVPPSPGASGERGPLMPWSPTPSSLNWDDGAPRSSLSRSRSRGASRGNSRGASRASSRVSSRGGVGLILQVGRPSRSRAGARASEL